MALKAQVQFSEINVVLDENYYYFPDKDADRMNFENDMFLKRQQQIMQLELAEAVKEQRGITPDKVRILNIFYLFEIILFAPAAGAGRGVWCGGRGGAGGGAGGGVRGGAHQGHHQVRGSRRRDHERALGRHGQVGRKIFTVL